MKLIKVLMVSTLIMVSFNVQAAVFSGNDIVNALENEENTVKAVLSGYIIGVHDGSNNNLFCTPKDATALQIIKVVDKWLINNQEKLHNDANELIIQSLSETYPCAKK